MTAKAQSFSSVMLICMLLLGGCVPPPKEPKPTQTAIQQAERAAAEQERKTLLRQINRSFEDPDAHYRLGQLYHADGQWAEAEYHYKAAMTFDPVHWPAQAATVRLLWDSGDTAKARTTADIYMNQVAASAERSLELGKEFAEQKLDDYALACYQQALRLDPQSAEAYKQLGYYYLGQDDEVRAKQYLLRSWELDRYQSDVAFELGLLDVEIKVQRKPVRGGTTSQPDQPAQ